MLGAIACLVVAVAGTWTFVSTRPYLKTTNPAPPAVQPNPPPKPSTTVIAPPKFSSAACSPEKASFYDDFQKTDSGWNIAISDQTNYADGQLVVTPAPNKYDAPKYLSLRYENATICAHIKSPSQVKVPDNGARGGVVFWATDHDNFYSAQIEPEGSYSISRKIAGTWITLIPPTKNDQIKSDPNAINEVTIVIAGHFAVLFVNNAKLQEFRGQPPKGGGAFGLYAESEKTAPDEWRFLDIAVMDKGQSKPVVLPPAPSGPTIGGCQATKPTDFQDGFQKPDPGWGITGSNVIYVDGQLSFNLDADQWHAGLYRPLVFKNATMCVTVKSPLAVSDLNSVSAGGLAFWAAADYQTFYVAEIFPNGTFGVYRRVGDSWTTVVQRVMSDKIKKGTGAVNELQVVLHSSDGLLYINGSQVSEFHGQPPQAGGATGLYAQSEKEQANDWRFLNITVVENQ